MSQQINLYSPLFRKAKKVFSARAMAQALGLLLAVLAAYYGYARYQLGPLQHAASESDRRLKAALEKAKALPGAPVEPGDGKALDTRIAALEASLGRTEELLAQTATPEHREYLEPLRALARQRLEGVWLSSISLAGESGELSLGGHALHAGLIPQYIEHLGRDPAMRGRHFSTLRIESGPAGAQKGTPGTVEFRLLASAPEGG